MTAEGKIWKCTSLTIGPSVRNSWRLSVLVSIRRVTSIIRSAACRSRIKQTNSFISFLRGKCWCIKTSLKISRLIPVCFAVNCQNFVRTKLRRLKWLGRLECPPCCQGVAPSWHYLPGISIDLR